MRFTSRLVIGILAAFDLALVCASPLPAPDASPSYLINADGTVSTAGSSVHLPPDSVLPSHTVQTPTQPMPRTNAERLARKLPLKKPYRLFRDNEARDPVTSPTAGYIKVNNANTNAFLGYVSASQTSLGNYGNFAADLSTALHVSLPSGSSELDILTLNGPSADAPYFGGVTGAASSSSNIGTGSYNYIFLSGTAETAPGATPQSATTTYDGVEVSGSTGVESAIWSYNAGTGALTPTWVNADGSGAHAGTLVYQSLGQHSYFGFAGDYTEYYNTFNYEGQITPLTFTFVMG